MKIKAIHARDFKGLKRADLDLEGRLLVVVTGRNAQGKTSLLDGIEAALGGAKAEPAAPVRRGASRAEVTVDLGMLVVTRRWSGEGRSSLTVKGRDGAEKSSPQTLLDGLYRRVAFDPVEFSRQEPKAQAKTLRTLAGLDAVFARIDARQNEVEAERLAVNRTVRELDGALKTMPPEEEFEGLPDAEVSSDDVMADFDAAREEAAYNDAVRRQADDDDAAHVRARRAVELAYAEVHRLELALEAARVEYDRAVTARSDAAETRDKSLAEKAALKEPDLPALRTRLNEVNDVNARVRRKRERSTKAGLLADAKAEADALTNALRNLDADRSAALAEARYPVEGLEVRGDDVLMNGVPLSACSSAERIRVGLGVVAALNPAIRFALVRDGSLLDGDGLAAMEAWAEATGIQVLVEVVGGTDAEEGVVIEAGEVLADRPRKPRKGRGEDADLMPGLDTPIAATMTPEGRDDFRLAAAEATGSAAARGRAKTAAEIHEETRRDADGLF